MYGAKKTVPHARIWYMGICGKTTSLLVSFAGVHTESTDALYSKLHEASSHVNI